MTDKLQLLPEWAEQEAVMLVWPDKHTDWLPWLHDVQSVYVDIISKLNHNHTPVLLLVRKESLPECQNRLDKQAKVLLVLADYNDTWIRDYGFLTLSDGQKVTPIEFVFNGWGDKFDASKDNQINQQVLAKLCQHQMQSVPLVLEGGAIEIDQAGHLLSTALCLGNPKRNKHKNLADYQQDFSVNLGAKSSQILQHGHLEGDDTDGHIDTLVRFTPDNALVIQSAFNRPDDSHFSGLSALVTECEQLFSNHKIFELPLPFVVNAQGTRLPASYANFLISNQQVLCPVYQQSEDALALEILAAAYPNFDIVPVNCLPLVQQFGSLHCISMQIPKGVLKPAVLQPLRHGVYLYE